MTGRAARRLCGSQALGRFLEASDAAECAHVHCARAPLRLSWSAKSVSVIGAVWSTMPLLEMLQIVGLCYLIGVVLTVGGALYPAWRAARMQPVVALRSEI